jgi:Flp pilus assembly pilin Flp
MKAHFYNLWQDEAGISSVEYALLVALIAGVSIGAWTALGGALRTTLTTVSAGFATPVN